jgi:hypothetical protein
MSSSSVMTLYCPAANTRSMPFSKKGRANDTVLLLVRIVIEIAPLTD